MPSSANLDQHLKALKALYAVPWPKSTAAQRDLQAKRQVHAKALMGDFAAKRGWKPTGKAFNAAQLAQRNRRRGPRAHESTITMLFGHPLADHPDFFVDAANRPVAVVCHNYGETREGTEAMRAWADEHGLSLERLTIESWYYPGSTIAYLYAPADG